MIEYTIKTKGKKRAFVMESELNRIPLHEYLEYENQVQRPNTDDEIQSAKFIYQSVGFWGKWSDTRERIGKAAEELSLRETVAIWKMLERVLFPDNLEFTEYFEINGERYFYPSENLKDSKFGDFVNANQIRHFYEKQPDKRNEESAFLMALLCRKENEAPFEKQEDLQKRFEFFKSNCTLLHLFTFSFFLLRQKITSLNDLNKRLQALQIVNGLQQEVIQ